MSLTTNLIAYYQCDAANPAADSYGSYTATLNSIGSQPGKFNESWEFSNSFDSANTGSTPNVGTYTISGWGYNIRAGWSAFATNNASGTSNHWYMAVNTGTNELGVWSNSTFTGSGYTIVPASLTGWHHYAVTRDSGGNVTFYIDGAQVGSVITPTMSGNFRIVYMGSEPGGTDYRWAERIDDYAIWNRALTATEIADIYTAGNAGNSLHTLIFKINSNLVHWFPLKVDGADSIGTATPATSSVTFTGSHAVFSASSSSYIHWGNIFNVGTSNLTMAGWVYVNSYAGGGHQGAVLSKATSSLNNQTGNALQFYANLSRGMIGSGGTKTEVTTSLPTTGVWHHIAMTRNGTTIKLYHDGVLVDTNTSGFVYNITSSGTNTFLTAGAIRVPGGQWFGGLDGNLNDLLAYDRALSASEIASIHAAGQGNFTTLFDSKLRGMFPSIVHSSPAANSRAHGMFPSIVHSAAAENGRLHGMFPSIVHSVPGSTAVVPDITGTPGSPATFDGSASTLVQYYHWSWVSVPGGSAIANAPIEFPDNSANTYFNMTDNELLVHMDGNANDTSGNARNGTVSGATQVTGRVGSNAYAFNGSAYIDFGPHLRYTTEDFTFAVWVKPGASQSAYVSVFSAHAGAVGTGYYMQQNAFNTNRYTFVGNNGSSWSSITNDFLLTAGSWAHVVFVRTGTRIVAYVNGVEVYDSPTGSCPTTIGYGGGTLPNFTLGGTSGSGAWNGELDEFASWTRALTAAEVAELYFLQFGNAAVGNGTNKNLGATFTFTPDVVGTYTINLAVSGSVNTNADCVVTVPASGGGGTQGGNAQGGSLQGHRTQGLI